MSKIITSPVKRFPGSVTLAYPIPFPAYLAWKDAINKASAVTDNDTRSYIILPGVCACVEAWNIKGLANVTPDTFPAAPRVAADRLLGWLISEIVAVVTEADEAPLE